MGASATPKNAVLMCRERLPPETGIEPDADDYRPDIQQILAEQGETQHENRHATAAPVIFAPDL